MSDSSTNSSEPRSQSEEWWRREVARQAYVAGWKRSRGCESYSAHQERTMNSCFEEWWNINHTD